MATNSPILLVEDNEDEVFILKRALKEAGIENPLHIVDDGQEAIDYLTGNDQFEDRTRYPLPTMVLLDLKLPLKSGHEVLAWIRQQGPYQSMIVIVLSSSEEPADIQRAYRLGANSYLLKPTTSEQFVDIVKAFKAYWLDNNRFGISGAFI